LGADALGANLAEYVLLLQSGATPDDIKEVLEEQGDLGDYVWAIQSGAAHVGIKEILGREISEISTCI
jgi:CRP-like cAMP-binding protein